MDFGTVASLFRLFVHFLCLKIVLSFNLDTDYTVIKQGPPGSFFGFAVAEHQVTNTATNTVEQWLLIAAPKANTSLVRSSIEAGTVYKCSATNSTSVCKEEVAFDTRGSSSSGNKNKQWFGVSLKSGGKDKSVLACAHRYLSYGPGNNFHLLKGVCRSMEGNLKSSEDFYSPCDDRLKLIKVPSYENYGQCLVGIGADIVKEQSTMSFLFGSVGIKNFEGRTFDHLSDSSRKRESNPMAGMAMSYFGYSVAHGSFLVKARKDVAMGGPRSNSTGKVVILKREATSLSPTIVLPAAADKVQIASGFGFALCRYQLNAKDPGYDQLLVGAPFHSNEATESGQVYVYGRSSETSMKLISTITVAIPRANFGAAIVAAGDLNLDGYNDIIIGAPYENDFTGAVYVFLGTAKGLKTSFNQKIAASKLDNKLRAFGRSLAGGMDLDSNGYNDILVGAYASDRVAFIRARPVIKIISKITTRPAKINPDDYKTKDQLFDIFVQYHYEERSKRLTSQIDATMRLELDPGRTPRIKFSLEDTNVAEQNVSVRSIPSRKRLTAYLKRDKDGKFQSFPDVQVKLTFQLSLKDEPRVPGVVTSLDKRPIIESHDIHGLHAEVHLFEKGFIEFKRDCDPCIPDLVLTASKNLTIRLGRDDVKLKAMIENKAKDTAFQTDIIVTLPKRISVSSIIANGDSKYCEDAKELPDGRQETRCKNVFNDIKSNQKEKIDIVLDTKSLSGDLDYKQLSVNVSSLNKEDGTYKDNVIDVDLEVVSTADLDLQGIANVRKLFYGGKILGESAIKEDKEAGHKVEHRYVVINKGPDKIPNAVVKIYWPYETVSGKHLFYLMDVKYSGANCTFARDQINELRLKSSSPSTDFNITAAALTVKRRRRDVSETNLTTEAPKVETTAVPSGDKKDAAKENAAAASQMEGKVLDCRKNTAKCTSFTCTIDNFRSRQQILIAVISRIWNPTMLMDYKTQTVSVVSHAEVSVGSNASYISDPVMSNNKLSIFTVLASETPKTTKERIAVWIIVLAVLAGIVLLALLVYGLYKLGFFKRTDKSRWRKKKSEEDDDLLDKKVPVDDKE